MPFQTVFWGTIYLPHQMQIKSGIIVHFKKEPFEIVIQIIFWTVLTKYLNFV